MRYIRQHGTRAPCFFNAIKQIKNIAERSVKDAEQNC